MELETYIFGKKAPKGFLKNLEKYNNIKLSKGVFLDNADISYSDSFESGVSSSDFGGYWYMLPKGRAIFKTYSGGDELGNIKNIRITNELLCYELSKQLGIRCAEYELASYYGEQGVVSYDVSGVNEKLVSSGQIFDKYNLSSNNAFKFYVTAQKKLEELGYMFDKEKMLLDLYKITLFDILTVQSDRHRSNVFMLINKKADTVKVAPLIDNEFAFNGLYFDTMLLDGDTITEETFKSKTYSISKALLIDEESFFEDNMLFANIKHVVNLAKQNPKMAEIFKNFVSNYNIQAAIDTLEQKGVTINQYYKDYLLMTEKFIKKMLKKELSNQKSSTSNRDYSFMN